MLSRLKNNATVDQVARVLRAELADGIKESQLLVLDMDEVCDTFAGLMVSLLQVTPRPTKDLMQKAASEAFGKISAAVAMAFGERLCAAFVYCRLKSKSVKSGKKLSPGTKIVVNHMLKLQNRLEIPEQPWSPLSGRPPVEKLTLGQKLKQQSKVRLVSSSKPAQLPLAEDDDELALPSSRASILALYGCGSSDRVVSFLQRTKEPSSCSVVQEIESSQEAMPAANLKLQYLDRAKLCMVRVYSDGSSKVAGLKPSSSGFGVAHFPGESEIPTEVPNLLLKQVSSKRPYPGAAKKRPSSRMTHKRPAGTMQADIQQDVSQGEQEDEGSEEESEEDVEADAVAVVPKPSSKKAPETAAELVVAYSQPYRYPSGAWAIRRRFSHGDKKQVFQICPKGRSDSAKKAICQEALERLLKGELESNIIQRAKNQ